MAIPSDWVILPEESGLPSWTVCSVSIWGKLTRRRPQHRRMSYHDELRSDWTIADNGRVEPALG
jgi:hypothetical protein